MYPDQAIIRMLLRLGSVSAGEVAQELDISRSRASYLLHELTWERAGRYRCTTYRQGRTVRYKFIQQRQQTLDI